VQSVGKKMEGLVENIERELQNISSYVKKPEFLKNAENTNKLPI
jgi:hypothetical protein